MGWLLRFLKRLFSGTPAKPVEAPPEFQGEHPPDWLIELKGTEMPDGRNFSIRALIFSETRTGLAQIRNGGSGQSATPDGALVNLERVELDRLLIILGFVFPGEITTVSSDAAEGVPVSLSIYRRIPLAHRAADCNLAGWLNSRKSAPPVIEIGCLLMNLRARAGQG